MKDNNNGLEQPTGKFAIPVGQRPKLAGWEFYNKVLGSPKLVVSAHYIILRYFVIYPCSRADLFIKLLIRE